MGAHAQWPPLRVGGRLPLRGIEYRMPVASAQVKSALLLAGLFAEGATTVIEPVRTRDHTERMLRSMGIDVRSAGDRVEVAKADRLEPLDIEVPGDLSAATFWLVAGGLVPGSTLRLPGVGVNPTRTAILQLLKASGFRIDKSGERISAGEPVADLEVRSVSGVRALNVGGATAAEMIDELPVLAVAGTQLAGVSHISGAAELRVKESDRIAAMAEGLAAMGAKVTALDDGWIIEGPSTLQGARVRSHGDHRIAMALAVAGLFAEGVTQIEDAECVEISYPGFFDQLESLC
jgi:3-phosphoshikimate 1-carboxyvinyltransferase